MVQYGIKGFKSKDQEYFDFVISILKGNYGSKKKEN